MPKPRVQTVAALAAAFLLAGCATAIQGTEEDVTVITEPAGATVQFSDGQSCQSPCTIVAKRGEGLNVTITKDDCKTHTVVLTPELGAGFLLATWGDYRTGAIYDLEPNPLSVELECQDGQ